MYTTTLLILASLGGAPAQDAPLITDRVAERGVVDETPPPAARRRRARRPVCHSPCECCRPYECTPAGPPQERDRCGGLHRRHQGASALLAPPPQERAAGRRDRPSAAFGSGRRQETNARRHRTGPSPDHQPPPRRRGWMNADKGTATCPACRASLDPPVSRTHHVKTTRRTVGRSEHSTRRSRSFRRPIRRPSTPPSRWRNESWPPTTDSLTRPTGRTSGPSSQTCGETPQGRPHAALERAFDRGERHRR